MTPPEAALWLRLRTRQPGMPSFRRQHPIGPYWLDFYCARLRFAVEVDGLVHNVGDQPERDSRRDAWLAQQGVEVFRISAADVFADADEVAEGLWNLVRARIRRRQLPARPAILTSGTRRTSSPGSARSGSR